LDNLTFAYSDITRDIPDGPFDLIHARFVLTHIPNPAEALGRMKSALAPGGVVVVEDIDFRGHFSHPESAALARYVALYTEMVHRRGGDANIGARLPALFAEAGFASPRMHIVHPAGHEGEVKLMSPITLQNIAPALLRGGLSTEEEIGEIVQELYRFARTPGTVAAMPRIVEVWASV
jgi:SAM-dependent methyltransferase